MAGRAEVLCGGKKIGRGRGHKADGRRNMNRRKEICAVCGESWNVSKDKDLTGKVYICPDCERKGLRKLKKSK